jgi:hypothetical protein
MMTSSGGAGWSIDHELVLEFAVAVDAAHPYAVEGMEGFGGASATILPVGAWSGPGPGIVLRPLTEPPGPFGLSGILFVTPFQEKPGVRPTTVAFEERIGRRYYEVMAAVRWRYAAACDVRAVGLPLQATCAEVYSIDAGSPDEAMALDAATPEPPQDVLDFYAECRDLKVPGSGRRIWLVPTIRA